LGVTRERDRHGCERWRLGTVLYSDNGAEPKMLADAGRPRDLWPRPEDVPGDVLFACEGEPDAVSLTELGFDAAAFPGVGKWSPEWASRLAAGRDAVYVIADCDPGGRTKALEVAQAIAACGTDAFVIVIDPSRQDGYDSGDLLAEWGRDDARAIINTLAFNAGPPVTAPEQLEPETVHLRIEPPAWPVLEPEALHGLAGDIVRLIGPVSEADPAALLLTVLVMFGNAAGRDSYALAEDDEHPPNLFVVTFGETSVARKGSALARVRRVFALAAGRWAADCVDAGIVSGEGVIWAVRDPIIRRRKPKKGEMPEDDGLVAEVVDEGVPDKRRLFVAREFSAVLKAAAREANTTTEVLREAWDGHMLRTAAKNTPARATRPHVSLLARVTAADLRRHLPNTDVLNGFVNRFLVAAVKRSKLIPESHRLADEALNDVANYLAHALTHAKVAGRMMRDEDAAALWRDEYPRLTRPRTGLVGAATSRAEAQVLRLSLIYALLDRADTIGVPHVRAALAVWPLLRGQRPLPLRELRALADRPPARAVACRRGQHAHPHGDARCRGPRRAGGRHRGRPGRPQRARAHRRNGGARRARTTDRTLDALARARDRIGANPWRATFLRFPPSRGRGFAPFASSPSAARRSGRDARALRHRPRACGAHGRQRAHGHAHGRRRHAVRDVGHGAHAPVPALTGDGVGTRARVGYPAERQPRSRACNTHEPDHMKE
jgi:hypothetical protein